MLLVAPPLGRRRWSPRPASVGRAVGVAAAAGVLAAVVSGSLLYRAETRVGGAAQLTAAGAVYRADGLVCRANGWEQTCRVTVTARSPNGGAVPVRARLRVGEVAYGPAGSERDGDGTTVSFRLPDGALPTGVEVATPVGRRVLPLG